MHNAAAGCTTLLHRHAGHAMVVKHIEAETALGYWQRKKAWDHKNCMKSTVPSVACSPLSPHAAT